MPSTDTAISVCNRALLLVGCNPITGFGDESTEGTVANSIYEAKAQSRLCAHRWNFARDFYQLTHIEDAPLTVFSDYWQLPPESIKLWAVRCDDVGITYRKLKNLIACDYDENSTLIAECSFRAAESEWDADFADAFECELAAIFAAAITRKGDLASYWQEKAERRWMEARASNGQQQTARPIRGDRPSRLLSLRSGGTPLTGDIAE